MMPVLGANHHLDGWIATHPASCARLMQRKPLFYVTSGHILTVTPLSVILVDLITLTSEQVSASGSV